METINNKIKAGIAMAGALIWVFAVIGFAATLWLTIAYFKWEWHYLYVNELGLTFGLGV